jgi:hypothetical protein
MSKADRVDALIVGAGIAGLESVEPPALNREQRPDPAEPDSRRRGRWISWIRSL